MLKAYVILIMLIGLLNTWERPQGLVHFPTKQNDRTLLKSFFYTQESNEGTAVTFIVNLIHEVAWLNQAALSAMEPCAGPPPSSSAGGMILPSFDS